MSEVDVNSSAQQGNAVATTKPAGAVSISYSDNALKALEETDGVLIGDMGMKVTRVPLEKYKASVTKVDRIAFITKKVIALKTHYIEGQGSILCLGKKCCEVMGMPAVRYIFPVVIYSTDNDGQIVGKKLDLKILSAGEDLYKSILTINRATEATGGIDSVDLLVTCTDDKYQKITLNQAGPAQWKRAQAAVQWVQEKWNSDAEFAYMAVARKVDEAALMKLLNMEGTDGFGTAGTGSASGTGSAPAGVSSQFNAASNPDLASFFNDDN